MPEYEAGSPAYDNNDVADTFDEHSQLTNLAGAAPVADLDDALVSLRYAVDQSIGGSQSVSVERHASHDVVEEEIEDLSSEDPDVAIETIDDLGAYFCRLLDPDLADLLLGDFRQEIEGCGAFGPELFVYFCMGLQERYADRRLASDLTDVDVIVALWELWDRIAPPQYFEDDTSSDAEIVMTESHRFEQSTAVKASLTDRLRSVISSIWRTV